MTRRPGKVAVPMTTVESVERSWDMDVRSTTSTAAAVKTSSSVRVNAAILPGRSCLAFAGCGPIASQTVA